MRRPPPEPFAGHRRPAFMSSSSGWPRIAADSYGLAGEAMFVASMRMVRFSQLSWSNLAEVHRMILEKYMTALGIYAEAVTGRLGPTSEARARRTIQLYRKAVRANRRRLSRS